jgi:protein-S-isoprenylcysteine O-methyltransferase Ste14
MTAGEGRDAHFEVEKIFAGVFLFRLEYAAICLVRCSDCKGHRMPTPDASANDAVAVPPGAEVGRSALQRRQRVRKRRIQIMAVVLLPLVLFVGSAWPEGGPVSEAIEIGSLLMIIAGIVGRTWCTLYIGGRKRESLVVEGPYSVVRHPLYLFTLLAVLGVGAQTGSLLVAVLLAVGISWPLAAVSQAEDKVLGELFPLEHRAYVARVPAFVPNMRLWTDVDRLEIRPAFAARTFLEACTMLLALPAAVLIHALQVNGALPVLLRLH